MIDKTPIVDDKARNSTEDASNDGGGFSRRNMLLAGTTVAAVSALTAGAPIRVAQAQAQQQPAPTGRPPNILIIWGDDIGYWNVSAYNQGMMGYKTPNIDRIAREGPCSLTGMGNKAAPPAALVSSPVKSVSALEC